VNLWVVKERNESFLQLQARRPATKYKKRVSLQKASFATFVQLLAFLRVYASPLFRIPKVL
jgi:hypothetical protein